MALASALDEGSLEVGPGCDRAKALAVLGTLPGVGPWTVQTVAMRALGDPDAFPGTDLGVRRGAESLGLLGSGTLAEHAEGWRPWRTYAVQYLWATVNHPINDWPPTDGRQMTQTRRRDRTT